MGTTTVVNRSPKEQERVEALIGQIKAQWTEVQLALRNAVARAVILGQPLAELKHVAFERWHDTLDQFCIPEGSANLAIRLHENRDVILATLERNPNLSFNGARALLPRERASGAGRKSTKHKALNAPGELKALGYKRSTEKEDDPQPEKPTKDTQKHEEASQSPKEVIQTPSDGIGRIEQAQAPVSPSSKPSEDYKYPRWLDMPGLKWLGVHRLGVPF